jgi:hypothetical protein
MKADPVFPMLGSRSLSAEVLAKGGSRGFFRFASFGEYQKHFRDTSGPRGGNFACGEAALEKVPDIPKNEDGQPVKTD